MATWPFGQKPRLEFRDPAPTEAVPLLLTGNDVKTVLLSLKYVAIHFQQLSAEEQTNLAELILNIETQSRMHER